MERLEGYVAALRERRGRLPGERSGSTGSHGMADIGRSAVSVLFMRSPSSPAHRRVPAEHCGRSNAETLFGMAAIARIVRRARAPTAKPSPFTFLGATLIAPGHVTVPPLPAEFVRPRDGAEKQDCEPAAARRWLVRVGRRHGWPRPVSLGDDLYAHQPMRVEVLAAGGSFTFGCKPSRQTTVEQCLTGGSLPASNGPRASQRPSSRTAIAGWRVCRSGNGRDALPVGWLEIEIAKPNGKETSRNGFVTNLPGTRQTVADLVACGRARWPIENGTFNVLNNNGDPFEHNFGRGKDTLASGPVARDPMAGPWQKARRKLAARNRLFTPIRSLTADPSSAPGTPSCQPSSPEFRPQNRLTARPTESPTAPRRNHVENCWQRSETFHGKPDFC